MAPPSVDAASTTASASTATVGMAAANGVAHGHVHAPAASSSDRVAAAAAAAAPEESADRAGTPRKGSLVVERLVRSRMPTRHGEFFVTLYRSSRDPAKEHMAIAMGDVAALSSVRVCGAHGSANASGAVDDAFPHVACPLAAPGSHPQRVLHGGGARLAAVRLRRAAADGHGEHRQGGRRGGGVPPPGGPRDRPSRQAPVRTTPAEGRPCDQRDRRVPAMRPARSKGEG